MGSFTASSPSRISWVTSLYAWTTITRCAGPADGSSACVLARKPSSTRFFSRVELSCSAPCTQWWLVTMSPSGDTIDAVQPPSQTTLSSGCDSGLASALASSATPILRKFSWCSGSIICDGIHMPPGSWYDLRKSRPGSGRRRREGSRGAGRRDLASVRRSGGVLSPQAAAERRRGVAAKVARRAVVFMGEAITIDRACVVASLVSLPGSFSSGQRSS